MVMISSTIDPVEGVLGSLLSGKDGNRTKFLKYHQRKKTFHSRTKSLLEFSIYIDFTHKNAIQGEFIARISRL